jgi:RHS repeat-associated protein
LTLEGINIYFGGKLLQAKGVWVATDRLGNVRANSNGETFSYFPYGEERTSTADGREKFGTYTRDGFGQDYAQQRYYNANMGAFWSPDPGGMKNANPLNPSTWNRYSYVMGDPVSRTDIHGLCSDQDKPPCFSTTLTGELPSDPGGGGGGSGTQAPEQGPGGDGGSDGGGGGQQNQALLNSIQSTLDAALSDPACASIFGTPGFLGGNATAKQVLNSLIQGNGPYGSIQFIDPDTATPGQMFLLGSNPAVTVSNHPFWSSLGGRSSSTIYINTLDVGNGFNTSTLNAEELVLHKLGHLLYNLGWSSKILPDPNAAASAANDQKLQNACGKYLK